MKMTRELGSLGGRPFAGALGEDVTIQSAPFIEKLAILDDRTKLMLQRLEEDAKARRLALVIGAVSALFAAAKLGIIAFPALRARAGRF